MPDLAVTCAGQTFSVPFGTAPEAWLSAPAVACLVNGRLTSLKSPLTGDAAVVPLDLSVRPGHRVYRRTLSFLLEVARRQAGLPALVPGPSWGGAHGWDPADGQPLAPGAAEALAAQLQALVAADRPLQPVLVPWDRALEALDHPDDAGVRRFLAQKNPAEVPLVSLDGRLWWAGSVLAPSTGRVTVGSLEASGPGVALTFPAKAWPLAPAPWRPSAAVAQAHADDRAWGRLQGVTTVADLNALADRPGALEALVQGAEAFQERRIAALADQAAARGARIVLIAGPSSSGKTTFAKRLAIQLGTLGRRPLAVSLDDYFVNREDTPKDAEGRYDFECLEAMDRPRLAADLADLLADQEVELPIFDFKTGRRKDRGRPYRLGSDGVLILEGIHGLNPDLWRARPPQGCFTIFVSALTSLTLEGRTRISASDHRLIRRLVRDRQFRGYSALQTLGQWPSVRRGEDDHLFPFQDGADGVFNSALAYELAVLREVALPLLETVPPSAPAYAQARDLIGFLEAFIPVPARLVPPFSLLREFVGQSGFHY